MLVAFVSETTGHDISYYRYHQRELRTTEMNDDRYLSTIKSITELGYDFTQNWLNKVMVIIVEGISDETLDRLLCAYELTQELDGYFPDYEPDYEPA